jgi:NAD-specific glutamate dehydrogenase
VDTRTRRWAVRALHDDLLEARRELVARALALGGDGGPEAAVDALLGEIDLQRARLERFLRSLALERAGGLPALTLAVRQLRTLADA